MVMRNRVLAAAVTVALAAGVVATVTGSAQAGSAAGVVKAPTTADAWTALFQAKNDTLWSGGDQVTSVKAAGFTYWLFGDTVRGVEAPDGGYGNGADMVANSILLQRGGKFVNAVAAGAQPAIPNPAPGERYWAQAAVYFNGYLYVFAQRVREDASDPIGFALCGVDIARFAIGADGLLTLTRMMSTPSSGIYQGRGVEHIQWAGDAILSGSGPYAYVYGYTRAEEGNVYIAHWSYLARVPMVALGQPGAWEYYAASTGAWVKTVAELSHAGNGPDAVVGSQISSARRIGTKYVILHKPWNGFGSGVKAMVGLTPWGPWSEWTIFDSPAGTTEDGRDYVTYSPQLHPEQTLSNGRVLVSIAWNAVQFADVLADADLYKPRFHAVVLP